MTTKEEPTLTLEQLPRLAPLFNGVALERLADELADPGAIYSPGECILLAVDLRRLADRIEAIGKDGALKIVRGGVGASAIHLDQSVAFEYKAPGETVSVDRAEVKHQLPVSEYPSLYKDEVDTAAVRKAFPPKDRPGIYSVTPRLERVDVKV